MPSLIRAATPSRTSPVTERSEVFRLLRSNLMVALEELERPTVLITSALPGEGKTSTCANLAASLAEAHLRVVAVDVDLRRPALHKQLGCTNEVGLSDLLLDRSDLQSALQFVQVGDDSGFYLLSGGTIVNNATELLASGRTKQLLDSLAEQSDVLLLDTPPVLPVADTLVIGRMVAGALLVVEARRTPVTDVQRAKDALIRNQTRLLGVVLNKVQPRDLGSHQYGYGPPAGGE